MKYKIPFYVSFNLEDDFILMNQNFQFNLEKCLFEIIKELI